ncbi:MAG: transposase [Planctomycetota bacterium]
MAWLARGWPYRVMPPPAVATQERRPRRSVSRTPERSSSCAQIALSDQASNPPRQPKDGCVNRAIILIRNQGRRRERPEAEARLTPREERESTSHPLVVKDRQPPRFDHTAPLHASDCGVGCRSACASNRHRHSEWLKFLRLIDRETPKHMAVHVIADNYATHKRENVNEWLARNPRFHMHFTPTSASWFNVVERFFRNITTKRIR